jgi:hypothetical protein
LGIMAASVFAHHSAINTINKETRHLKRTHNQIKKKIHL